MEWISFEDKEPSNREIIIVNTSEGVGVGRYDILNHCVGSLLIGDRQPGSFVATHWMKLPEPPTDN